MDKIKKLLNKNTLFIVVAIIIALHPFIELDYLAYELLDKAGLPRLTTVIDYLVLPAIVLLTFILFEKNKKRIGILFGIYAAIFCIYFVLHCQNADYLQYNLRLPKRYVFLISDEVFYTITLLLPLFYIWVVYLLDITEKGIKYISTALSCLTALPIFISNIFVFGESTYEGYTIANIFSWFTLPYNDTTNHPRKYATKFFFEEGNTIGILMAMVLPLLYYFFYKAEDKKEKTFYGVLIFIQSLSMIMLSTRVATYFTAIIPVAMFAIYIILIALKYEKFKPLYVSFLIIMTIISAGVIPFGPAYQNQQIDAMDYGFLKDDDDKRNQAKEEVLRGSEGLEPFSKEWLDFYTYMFEDYSYLIGVTPPVYYKEWYDYKEDPKFWVDLMFDYELEERVSGRQIQTIFTHYKWDPLTTYQKSLGMGYGTFMRGSILLERDFAQQYFSYGYIGFVLIMAPWLIIVAYLGIRLLLGYKDKKWIYINVVLMMIICIGLLSSYVSGHTLDELTSSLFIALCAGLLFKNLRSKYVED